MTTPNNIDMGAIYSKFEPDTPTETDYDAVWDAVEADANWNVPSVDRAWEQVETDEHTAPVPATVAKKTPDVVGTDIIQTLIIATNVARDTQTTVKKEKIVKAKQPNQNGVTMPRPGTKTRAIWDTALEMSTELGRIIHISKLKVVMIADGYNVATINTQYARWKKYNGVVGTIPR